MKLNDLSEIEDPIVRFVQASKALRNLQAMVEVAAEIRDRSLIEARTNVSQTTLASLTGISQQQVSRIETRARTLYDIQAPWESESKTVT